MQQKNLWLYAAIASYLSVFFFAAWNNELWVSAVPSVLLILNWLLFRPKILVYFAIFITPLSIPIKDLGGGLGLSVPTEPIYWLLIGFTVLSIANGQKMNQIFLKNPISRFVFFDLAWTFITSIFSEMPIISMKFFIAKLIFVGVFYFGFAHFFNNEKRLKKALMLFCLSTFFLVVYTLTNHAKYGFARYFGYTAMRPFLPDHGVYAALVAFSLILSLIFLIHSKHLQISWLWRLVLFVMFCVMVAGIVFSFTRAAWVSLVLSLLIYLLLRLKVRFAFLLSIGALFGIYLISNWSSINYELTRNKSESDDDLATHVESIGNVSSDPSNLERLNRWDAALEMFRQRPVLGWGPGTYTFVYGQHQRSNNMTLISTNAGDVGGVHSEYLRTISESGFLGGVFFLVIVLLAFQMGFSKYHSYEEGLKKYLHLALFLALVTYFSHGVLNNYSDYDKIALPFWGFLSAMVVLENRPKENEG